MLKLLTNMDCLQTSMEGFYMEYFMIGVISVILFSVLLGWFVIGASPLIVPFVGIIYLVFKSNDISQTEPHLSLNPAADTSTTLASNDCVLIVDDQYATVIPLMKILEQAKVPFKYVSDGIEAIKELSQNRFRFIFMDQFMPELTGTETLAAADEVISTQDLMPVIFYSGTDMTSKVISQMKHLLVLGSWDKTLSRMELQQRLIHLQLVSQ